jgi:hypothetical protein
VCVVVGDGDGGNYCGGLGDDIGFGVTVAVLCLPSPPVEPVCMWVVSDGYVMVLVV